MPSFRDAERRSDQRPGPLRCQLRDGQAGAGLFPRACGHESAGLRYPVEIHDGSNYEGREDLGNTTLGWGVKFAGTGWIQVTGAYWHRKFGECIGDPKVFELGKTYTSEKYPWSICWVLVENAA